MADSKVSELTTATTVGGSDLLYLVQTNTSKKVTTATLFANAGNVTLKGNINLDPTVQLLASPGVIDLTKPVTQLSADATGGNLILPDGTTNQIKVIVMVGNSGGALVIRSNVANSANITFNSVGDTATLLYTFNDWYMIGGTATVT
jgi:hypothetical protein